MNSKGSGKRFICKTCSVPWQTPSGLCPHCDRDAWMATLRPSGLKSISQAEQRGFQRAIDLLRAEPVAFATEWADWLEKQK